MIGSLGIQVDVEHFIGADPLRGSMHNSKLYQSPIFEGK